MQEAVEQRDDAGRIGKDFVPLFEWPIGGEDHRFSFVTAVYDFIEQVGGLVVEGEVTYLIDKCSAEHLLTNVKLSEMWS